MRLVSKFYLALFFSITEPFAVFSSSMFTSFNTDSVNEACASKWVFREEIFGSENRFDQEDSEDDNLWFDFNQNEPCLALEDAFMMEIYPSNFESPSDMLLALDRIDEFKDLQSHEILEEIGWCSTVDVYTKTDTNSMNWGYCYVNGIKIDRDDTEIVEKRRLLDFKFENEIDFDKIMRFLDNETETEPATDPEDDEYEPSDEDGNGFIKYGLPILAVVFIVALGVFLYHTYKQHQEEVAIQKEADAKLITDIVAHQDYKVNVTEDEIEVELPTEVLSVDVSASNTRR